MTMHRNGVAHILTGGMRWTGKRGQVIAMLMGDGEWLVIKYTYADHRIVSGTAASQVEMQFRYNRAVDSLRIGKPLTEAQRERRSHFARIRGLERSVIESQNRARLCISGGEERYTFIYQRDTLTPEELEIARHIHGCRYIDSYAIHRLNEARQMAIAAGIDVPDKLGTLAYPESC